MRELSVEEGRALFGGKQPRQQPASVEESQQVVRGTLSEEEWQRQVVELAVRLGWIVYHALPAQHGLPRGLKGRLEELQAAITARNLKRALMIVRSLLEELKPRWRTPVTSPGFPDLFMVRGPRMVIAELKSEAGRLRPDQREWLARLELTAAEVYVWRPRDVAEVQEVLSRAA